MSNITGCGPLKHHVAKDSFTIGFDTCVEALLAGTQTNAGQYKDVVLADIAHLPFRLVKCVESDSFNITVSYFVLWLFSECGIDYLYVKQ